MLHLEVAKLLKQGYLKDLLTGRDLATRDKALNRKKDDTPPIPPWTDKVINVINGGSKVSGVLYAVAKRSSCQAVRPKLHITDHHDPRIL